MKTRDAYCVRCKNTITVKSPEFHVENGRTRLTGGCPDCGCSVSRFVKAENAVIATDPAETTESTTHVAHCLKCKEKQPVFLPVLTVENGRKRLTGKCAKCLTPVSRFVKADYTLDDGFDPEPEEVKVVKVKTEKPKPAPVTVKVAKSNGMLRTQRQIVLAAYGL